MRVFVYEFVTGGGAGAGGPLTPSLLAEGRAMAAAVTTDFARLAGVEVLTTQDASFPGFHDPVCRVTTIGNPTDEQATFQRLAASADWTLVIAPESGHKLLERCEWVLEAGGRLLSPSPSVVELAGDKNATCTHLRRAGVPTPGGCIVRPAELAAGRLPDWLDFPAVLKPPDGCGSQGVRRIENLDELCRLPIDEPQRLERLVPGLAASVAVLCGSGLLVPLPACEQRLSDDGRFTYLGGRLPLPPELNRRAQKLALAAVGSLPEPLGYLGVDLVLGQSDDGSGDAVIEINPRLTTSYVGLRTQCRENLAAAMLAVAGGERPALSWRTGSLQFSSEGQIVSDCGTKTSEVTR